MSTDSSLSGEDYTTDVDDEELNDLGKFVKTSFASFLHYALELVDAVPRRESAATVEEINKDLEICLEPIVGAMKDQQNQPLMQMFNEALKNYCEGPTQVNRHELVNATNAAFLFLQPLSIGNSKSAANPNSENYPLFLTQTNAISGGDIPTMFCAMRKHKTELCSKDTECQDINPQNPLGDLASQSESRFMEWGHLFTCWQSTRASIDGVARPTDCTQSYTTTPLKEYWDSHTDERSLNAKRCAGYAKKIFNATFGRDHVMNVAINDEFLCVWYFDHESAIQTSAFNFIEDRPYFLLFLFALQRFSTADWGIIDQLSPLNANIIEPLNLSGICRNNGAGGGEVAFKRVNNVAEYHHVFPRGRATHVISGSLLVEGKNTPAVLKLSWRQKARFPEGCFIEEATNRLEKQQGGVACDYLPTLLGVKDFSQFSTDLIRRKLGLAVENEATRLPYLIVLPRYEPLTVNTTDWKCFFEAYVALIYCHLMLWSVGIEHRDISDSNLMWDKKTKKPKLCDFDLSHFAHEGVAGFTNTGTKKFMALDLLTPDAMDGKVKRLYRHDLETFCAVLIWIMLSFKNGVFIENELLEPWNSCEPGLCAQARRNTYQTIQTMDRPEDIPAEIWDAAVGVAVQAQEISDEHQYLLGRFWRSNNRTLPEAIRQRHMLSAAEKKRMEHLGSANVIADFLPILVQGLPSSDLLQDIVCKIKRLGFSTLHS